MSSLTSSSRRRAPTACSRISTRNVATSSSSALPSQFSLDSDDDDANDRQRFQVCLPNTYRDFLDLPMIPQIAGNSRWVVVRTEHNREFMMNMIRTAQRCSFTRGWDLLAAVEDLEEGHTIMFEIEDESSFYMCYSYPTEYKLPLGFSKARHSSSVVTWTSNDYFAYPGTLLTPNVYQAMYAVWASSSMNGPMFVRTLFPAETYSQSLEFTEGFFAIIPTNVRTVAMRFVDSDIVIPGSIDARSDGIAVITEGWTTYVDEHNLCPTEIFVRKIYRGPTVWDMIGCCAAP